MNQLIQIHLIEASNGFNAYSPSLMAFPSQVLGESREAAVANWKAEFSRVVKRALNGENIPQMNMVKRGVTKPEDFQFQVFEFLPYLGKGPLEMEA